MCSSVDVVCHAHYVIPFGRDYQLFTPHVQRQCHPIGVARIAFIFKIDTATFKEAEFFSKLVELPLEVTPIPAFEFGHIIPSDGYL